MVLTKWFVGIIVLLMLLLPLNLLASTNASTSSRTTSKEAEVALRPLCLQVAELTPKLMAYHAQGIPLERAEQVAKGHARSTHDSSLPPELEKRAKQARLAFFDDILRVAWELPANTPWPKVKAKVMTFCYRAAKEHHMLKIRAEITAFKHHTPQ